MSDIENEFLKTVLVPGNFAICSLSACVRKDECLHYNAQNLISKDLPCVIAVNPRHVNDRQLSAGTCGMFLKTEIIRKARGFLAAFNTIPIGKRKTVEQQLRTRYCQAVYYRIRKGTRSLSPEEQRFVSEILVANGAVSPVAFDSYEYDFNWGQS